MTINYTDLFNRSQFMGAKIIDARGRLENPFKSWEKRSPNALRGVVIHQTAGGDSLDALARYHMGPNHITKTLIKDHPFKDGLPGIAYTFFVNKKGEVFLANAVESTTWSHGDTMQPGDENALFMSACFGGKFAAQGWPEGKEEPTHEQLNALAGLWRLLSQFFNFTDLDIYGHYHFGKPTCPGDMLKTWIDLRRGTVKHSLNDPKGQQRALAKLGHYKGAIDGAFGPASRAALHEFLSARKLPATDTWTYLATAEMVRLKIDGT